MAVRVRAAAARAAAPPDCPKNGHCRPSQLPLPVERRNDAIDGEAASGEAGGCESPKPFAGGGSSKSIRETGAISDGRVRRKGRGASVSRRGCCGYGPQRRSRFGFYLEPDDQNDSRPALLFAFDLHDQF